MRKKIGVFLALVDLFGIKKQYDLKILLDDIDFHLNSGERIAIVGQNGCGKSTLMKIISSEEEPSDGKKIINGNIQIEMLSQNPKFKSNVSTKKAIELELTELYNAKKEYDEISLKLANDFENKELLEKHSLLSNFLDHHNAWSLDDKIERVLKEFHLKEYEDRLVYSLSGGEQRRVALAGLILKKPDVLLLDEPTNHLDVYMVEFLEEMLLKEKFTLLFISHDRYFIDNIATRVIEIENHKLVSYNGGYQNFLQLKEQRLKSLQKSHENLLKLLKQEEDWLGKSVRAREKRNQGRKQRVFDLRDKAKTNPSLIRKITLELEREKKHFNREDSVSRKKMLFELHNISYNLPDRKLIDNFSYRILQRDKIAIVGPNGAGKSTLLKLILGKLEVDSGSIDRGDFTIGYFDQHRDMLHDDKTLIETFCPNGGDTIELNGQNTHVYGYLKSFLFPKEYLTQKIGMLSGGEKNRVALALLLAKKVDCLILDEPTNDLDIQTITILEDQLINFSGALLVVSHDRYFVDKVASKLLMLKGDETIEESYQSYSEYLAIEKEIKELMNLESEIVKASDTIQKNETKPKIKNKLSYKEQREFELLPVELEELESKLDEVKKCLGNPECYAKKGLKELTEILEDTENLYNEKSEKYLALWELFESLNS
jgi:ABC transport system ATP-binding/permease protein